MAKKEISGYVKLQIMGGQANPAPPVGPALGQRGINIMEFCKAFNAKTQEMEAGAPCPTIITYYVDKSFSMEIKTPPASFFLKKAVNIKSGSQTAGKETVAQISSIKIQSFFETSPITFITSDTLAFSLLLSIIARSQSTLLAIALALTTPPTSGETTITSFLSLLSLI